MIWRLNRNAKSKSREYAHEMERIELHGSYIPEKYIVMVAISYTPRSHGVADALAIFSQNMHELLPCLRVPSFPRPHKVQNPLPDLPDT